MGGDAGAGGIGGMGGIGALGACSNASDFAELATLAPDNARTLTASVTVTDQCENLILDRAMFDQCVVDGVKHFVNRERFAHVVAHAQAEHCDGDIFRAMEGHQDDGDIALALAHRLQDLTSVHAGHLVIQQDQVGRFTESFF